MIKVAVSGAAGRMGSAVARVAAADAGAVLTTAVGRAGSDAIGRDLGAVSGAAGCAGVTVTDSLDGDFDVLIDFTTPAATVAYAKACAENSRRMVIGTTGLGDADKAAITAAAGRTAIVLAPNMSVGVTLCLRLLAAAARALGDSADIEIVEAHHRHKRDAPSGTALRMGEAVAAALGRDLKKDGVFARHGATGPRPPGAIGFSTIRAADIVGEHSVWFASPGERVEITHRAADRINFAHGALRAAKWLATQERGLFDMGDVLGL